MQLAPPSLLWLDDLDNVVARLCASGDTSPSRQKQLRWVAGELRRAFHRGHLAPDVQTLSDALALPCVMAYLDAADEGHLRRRPITTAPGSEASRGVREDCLKIIANAANVPLVIPEVGARPKLAPVVAVRPRAILTSYLRLQEQGPGRSPGRIRLLAVLGLVLDTGARGGELCNLRITDLGADLVYVRLTRLPQHRALEAEPEVQAVELSQPTRAALAAWLIARAELVKESHGTSRLLVSLVAGHGTVNGRNVHRPPGMPLEFRGLARAYARGVADLNAEMEGRPGWEALPGRMEQLRRAIHLEAVPGHAGPLRYRRAQDFAAVG